MQKMGGNTLLGVTRLVIGNSTIRQSAHEFLLAFHNSTVSEIYGDISQK